MDFVQFHLLVFAPMFIDQFRTCFKIRDVTDSSDTFFFFFHPLPTISTFFIKVSLLPHISYTYKGI